MRGVVRSLSPMLRERVGSVLTAALAWIVAGVPAAPGLGMWNVLRSPSIGIQLVSLASLWFGMVCVWFIFKQFVAMFWRGALDWFDSKPEWGTRVPTWSQMLFAGLMTLVSAAVVGTYFSGDYGLTGTDDRGVGLDLLFVGFLAVWLLISAHRVSSRCRLQRRRTQRARLGASSPSRIPSPDRGA